MWLSFNMTISYNAKRWFSLPNFDSPFFMGTNPRGGFACVEDFGFSPPKPSQTYGFCGYGTHSLHSIEHQSFCFQNGLTTAGHIKTISP